MKITGLEVEATRIRLKEPYVIAYEQVQHADAVFVRLLTDRGPVGRGCAAPDLPVTGESLEQVARSLTDDIAFALRGEDPLSRMACLERVEAVCPGQPSVSAAIDMALHDWLGQHAGVPLFQLLGGFRPSILTSITLGIRGEAETLDRARVFVAQGFRALKLKGGHSVDDDVARVRRVREVVGPSIELRFDANQGYTVENAMRFLAEVESVGVTLLEQPTPAGKLGQLGEVTRRSKLPVMADESLLGPRDAFRIASRELADMVNIKLMKAGGIARAQRIDAVARTASLESMVGCMDESSLGIAAGLHFALSSKNVAYADLDGHLDLVDDPMPDFVRLIDGELWPADGPGLGFPSR